MERRHTIISSALDGNRGPSLQVEEVRFGGPAATSVLLSHSWLSVLTMQRVRNSSSALPSQCSRGPSPHSNGWSAADLLRASTSKGRWGRTGTGDPSRRTSRGGDPILRGRTLLRYYARRSDSKKAPGGAAAIAAAATAVGDSKNASERHNTRVPHHEPAAPKGRNDEETNDRENPLSAADRVQRQWHEYLEHERMCHVLSHRDSSDEVRVHGNPEEDNDVTDDDDESSEAAAIPTTIRLPTKVADNHDGSSVVSDLSLLDDDEEEEEDEEEDRDDENVVPWLGLEDEGEGGGFSARVPSPGSRPSRKGARKVKISVTGTGQVPAVRPYIVASIRRDETWGMTTADLQDDVLAWPSDEDDNDEGTCHQHPRRSRGASCAVTTTAVAAKMLKASPTTTASLSSSSFASSTQHGPTSNRRDATPSETIRTAPALASSPELEPSRLFRDFRKSTGVPTPSKPSHRHRPRAAAAHCRNRHVLVGGSAVLVRVERRQDMPSSSRGESTLCRSVHPSVADSAPPSIRVTPSLIATVL